MKMKWLYLAYYSKLLTPGLFWADRPEYRERLRAFLRRKLEGFL